jgi:glutamine synthetase
MAVFRNHKLYLAAIATPGNEIRLGGHEAPPRIFSVFLGTALTNFLDGKASPSRKDLQEILSFLNYSVKQENTDRNRTSPYAYTGNRFEFRAVGSSQNPSFSLAVIAATVTKEIRLVIDRLSKGENVADIIKDLQVQTQAIRFEGNGYSE